MTRWELHVRDWKDCTRCELSRTRKNVCLARGSMPCDVLFVGQAPGRSEDVEGQPFVGQAGRLLQSIIAQAFFDPPPHKIMTSAECDCDGSGMCNICDGGLAFCTRCRGGESDLDAPCVPYSYSFSNLVGCLPLDGRNEVEPEDAHVKACKPRLEAEIEMLRPRLIVCVGKLAAEYLTPGFKHSVKAREGIVRVEIVHPSFILSRLPIAARPLAVKRCVVTIRDALERL